jgi:hypothetical protein
MLGAASLCAAAWAAMTGDSHVAAHPPERLPDLDQEVPHQLQVTGDDAGRRPSYRLGFGSAVRNIGAGPLIISGERDRTAKATMTADQLIEREVTGRTRVEGVGRLRYVRSPDHAHWHLVGFMRYELRHAGKRAPLVRDRKTGFCLGDRYRASGPELPARPAAPVYTGRCGLGATALQRLVQGISVGYGDNFRPNLEGQSLRLTGLRAGRYVLVHRVNVDRRLRESSYRNNASSVLLRLRWRSGEPHLRMMKRCPNTARCVPLVPTPDEVRRPHALGCDPLARSPRREEASVVANLRPPGSEPCGRRSRSAG